MLTGKTIGELTLLETLTPNTLIPAEFDGASYHFPYSAITFTGGTSSGGGLIETTYSELYDSYTAGTLSAGTYYAITDYQTIYVQPGWIWVEGSLTALGTAKTGDTEVLVVLAISGNTLAPQAFSPQYPQDKITYDITYTLDELSNPAKGRITERITATNNRADYDLRGVQFKRYDAYYSDSFLYYKTVNILGTGEVQGVSGQTFFSGDLSVGNIIGIVDGTDNIGGITFYEITNIVSDVEMYVTGQTIVTASNVTMVRGSNFGDPISPYPTNILTNTASTEHYTFDNGLDSNYSNYLGDYFNLEFEFRLSNNVFFGGTYNNNIFGTGSANNTFDDDMDSIRTGIRFSNNILTNDFESNVIGDDFKYNYISCDMEHNIIGDFFTHNMITDNDGEDFDNNRIGNFFEFNYIPMYDQFTNNTIGDGFYQNVILNNINDTLMVSSFSGNFVNGGISSCAFYGFTTNNTFQSNLLSSQFGNGFSNNTVDSEVSKTSVGPNFTSNTLTGNTFNKNRIGPDFTNNIIGNDFDSNEIGSDFNTNNIYGQFLGNQIGEDFYQNNIYDLFQKNRILNEFNTNTIGVIGDIGGNTFENNDIMNNFKGNNIQGDFWSNRLKTDFKGNQTFAEFGYNNFGFGCIVSNFSGQTIHNTIGDYFSFNNCYGSFSYNTIGTNFYSNEVGDGFGFGGGSYRGNRIGNNFNDNNIGEYFYNNYIEDNFTNNTVGYYFQLNDIKVNGLNGINFTEYQGNVLTISNTTPSSSGDGVYNVSQTSTTGHGNGLYLQVTVSGGVVTSVVVMTAGTEYLVGDQITVSADQFEGLSDLVITVGTVSDEPLVYTTANCTIQTSRDGFNLITTLDFDTVSWYISEFINEPYNP